MPEKCSLSQIEWLSFTLSLRINLTTYLHLSRSNSISEHKNRRKKRGKGEGLLISHNITPNLLINVKVALPGSSAARHDQWRTECGNEQEHPSAPLYLSSVHAALHTPLGWRILPAQGSHPPGTAIQIRPQCEKTVPKHRTGLPAEFQYGGEWDYTMLTDFNNLKSHRMLQWSGMENPQRRHLKNPLGFYKGSFTLLSFCTQHFYCFFIVWDTCPM